MDTARPCLLSRGAGQTRHLDSSCDRQATPKPPASHLQARKLGCALLCSSCAALVLLVFSSCFSLGRRWGLHQHCGVSTAPMPSFDGVSVAVIQIKLEYWKLSKAQLNRRQRTERTRMNLAGPVIGTVASPRAPALSTLSLQSSDPNSYSPDPTASTASRLSFLSNWTPDARSTGLPPSVTGVPSFAGRITVAVAPTGTCTCNLNCPATQLHSLTTLPCAES